MVKRNLKVLRLKTFEMKIVRNKFVGYPIQDLIFHNNFSIKLLLVVLT